MICARRLWDSWVPGRRYAVTSAVMFALLLVWRPVPVAAGAEDFNAFVYDRNFVLEAPLDAKVLSASEEEGIVHEEVEFVGCLDPEGNPIRTFGRLYRPAGAKNLPVIQWCEGGMADARVNGIALTLAQKGYLTLSINLPKKEWGAYKTFNTEKPADANFVRFAVTYMRGITYLLSRPEADVERVGVGGASYGGVFATLVSGLDSRVDTGMSFFSGGNHRLGSNLPQFTALENLEQVAVFSRTGDGAFYHKKRYIPFFWGVAANDNWFYFPAVVQTWRDAQSPDKRMGIVPLWEHGFPGAFDQQLFDWFDIYLTGTRAPYNQPGPLEFSREDNALTAEWGWQGDNPVERAELVVSYGLVLPWHGWVHRLYDRIPASIEGGRARAEVPVAEPDIEMLVFPNMFDANEVLTSGNPIVVRAGDFGVTRPAQEAPEPNGCPWGDFEEDAVYHFVRYSMMPKLGEIDAQVFHGGKQSLRVAPDAEFRQAGKPLRLKLFNVYARSHTLRLWLKTDRQASATIRVKGVLPRNWSRPAVQAILTTMPRSLKAADVGDAPVFESTVSCGEEWASYDLACPFTGRPVEGYNLEIQFPEDSETTYWLDDITFTPVWQVASRGG